MTLKTISARSRLYLQACDDWKADWEIVKLMGDTPPMEPRHARPHLGRLIGAGLLTWSRANNTYRATEKGRLAAHGEELKDSGNGN